MSSIPQLQTKKCIINEMLHQDAAILQEILDDSLTCQYLPEIAQVRAQHLIDFFAFYCDMNEGVLWAIRNVDYRLVGFIAIMDLSMHPTLFYAMHPNFRKQGFMKEAVKEILRYASTKWSGLIYSEVNPVNLVSQHILLSAGFRQNNIIASGASKLIYEFDLP